MAHFVDTNIVVYAFGPGLKAEPAIAVLSGATISVQVLNEFANVCLRKLHYNHSTLDLLIAEIRALVKIIEPIGEETHDLARESAAHYMLGFYDSALVAAALLAECDTFYSEDMQNGLVFEGQMRIVNPFS